MIKSLRAFPARVILTVLMCLTVSGMIGCGGRPERTEDPAEVEKLRQEHLKQAEREMRESS